MDRDNKYYELIEGLVKQNRKFPGYEAILEDIIDDVYAHSQVIISSIDNENVIKAYLEKVITTSIITVSKKMNFNNNIRHRVVSKSETDFKPILKQQEEIVETLPALNLQEDTLRIEDETVDYKETSADNNVDIEDIAIDSDSDLNLDTIESPNLDTIYNNDNVIDNNFKADINNTETIQKANPDFVDKMINSIDSEMVINLQNNDKSETDLSASITDELSSSTDELIDEETISYSGISEIEDLGNLKVEDDLNTETDENNIETINSDYEENDNLSIDTVNIDKIDYDNSENTDLESESADNDIETIDFTDVNESGSIDKPVNDTEDLNSAISIETNLNPQSEELSESFYDNDLTDNSIEDSNSDLEEIEDVNYDFDIEEQDSETITNESELTEENSITLSENDSFMLEENPDENLIPMVETAEGFSDVLDDNGESNEILEFENSENNQNDINIEPDMAENLTIDTSNSEIEIKENFEIDSIDDNITEMNQQIHKDIDYTAFAYIPEDNKNFSNINEISNKIIELDSNNPNLRILKIFDLKYKQNLTIEQIAEKLSINKQDIVLALDALVDLI